MQSDLIDQMRVAAEAARQEGFEGTYKAMMDILRCLKAGRIDAKSPREKSIS